MAIKLVNEQDKLTLGTPVIAGGGGSSAPGEDGGYYIPTVDAEGNLSWTPSEADMPGVDTVNIKGEPGYTPIKGVDYFDGEPGAPGYTPIKNVDYFDGKDGADGEPGVYVGSSAPTDDSLIWINPEEEPEQYATTTYVDEAIANVDIPESSGGGAQALVFIKDSTIQHQAALEELMTMYHQGATKSELMSKYIFYYYDFSYGYLPASVVSYRDDMHVTSIEVRGNYPIDDGYAKFCVITTFTTGTATIKSQIASLWTETLATNDWTTTDALYGDNIYNAKEIFIRGKALNSMGEHKWIFSHFICNQNYGDTIGSAHQYDYIAFTSVDNTVSIVYWYFDGWNINFTDTLENVLVAYKT